MHETAEALVGPDATEDEAVECALAMLKEIAPRDAREALIARRLIALDALAMETIALAKASAAYPMLRDAYAAQAVALSRAATSLDEALERRRGGGQRVVEVKHVVVHSGGQAIVGRVHRYRPGSLHPRPVTMNERPEQSCGKAASAHRQRCGSPRPGTPRPSSMAFAGRPSSSIAAWWSP